MDQQSNVELGVLKSVVSKLDNSIEKITSLNAEVTALLAVHEQRLDALEKADEGNDEDFKDLHSRITTQIQLLADKLDAHNKEMGEKLSLHAKENREQREQCRRKLESDIQELGERITKLEQWKWWIMGAAAAVGYIVNMATKVL